MTTVTGNMMAIPQHKHQAAASVLGKREIGYMADRTGGREQARHRDGLGFYYLVEVPVRQKWARS